MGLNFVGPIRYNPLLDPLAELHLDNQLYITILLRNICLFGFYRELDRQS